MDEDNALVVVASKTICSQGGKRIINEQSVQISTNLIIETDLEMIP